MGYPVWAEIDMGAFDRNLREVRRLAGPSAVMAVVKANAYGHGLVPVARAAVSGGAGWLGVARGAEALELRHNGVGAPVLVLGYVHPDECRELLPAGVSITAYDEASATAFAGAAQQEKRTLRVHFKVDTGMGRLGFPCGKSGVKAILAAARLPNVEVEGLFTHFACADEPDEQKTLRQLELFLEFARELERAGLAVKYKHAANSAALIRLPETRLDMVRPGIILYGLYPSRETCCGPELTPVMSWKARVVQVKEVAAGFPVSYGWTYRTDRRAVLATVAVGYGDGYSRMLSGRGEVLLHGLRAPVVGRVCMDQIVVDASNVKDVAPGDEAVLFGRQEGTVLPVDEMAAKIGTINYEVVCAVGARVPRVYL